MAPKKTGWLDALAGTGLSVRSARDAAQVVGWLDTGNFALNWAISGRFGRGYPLGHTVEIFGDPSTGKTFLLARAIAMVQEMGRNIGEALLDDTERAWNLEWVGQALGVDVDRLGYESSRTVKEYLEVAQKFLEAVRAMRLKAAVLACDSLSELSTEHEIEKGLDKRDMTKAPELKAFFRIMGGDLGESPVVHLMSSHIIATPGEMFQKRTTSGGGGPKFHSSIRIDMRSPSKLQAGDKGDYIGVWTKVFVDKNRLCPPWKEVRLVIPFYQPISRASGLVPVLVRLGVLEKRGDFLTYQDKKVGRAYKADKKEYAFRMDEQGEQLLDSFPEILEETDELLAKNPQLGAANGVPVGDEAEEDTE